MENRNDKRNGSDLTPQGLIEKSILLLRGHKVMLDEDLAPLYGVETRILVRNVKRHLARFPDDFMFQLSNDEFEKLKTIRAYSGSHGGRRFTPYAFTEQGIAMLSSVLNSPKAISVNIEIMRAFVRLREVLSSHKELARKLVELEQRYDKQFKAVFDAIRAMMSPSASKSRPIGFGCNEDSSE